MILDRKRMNLLVVDQPEGIAKVKDGIAMMQPVAKLDIHYPLHVNNIALPHSEWKTRF